MFDAENYLAHYGTPRKSGRYPWGSGDEPYQNGTAFLAEVTRLRKEGLSEAEVAASVGLTTTQLRATKSIARNQKVAAEVARAVKLREQGLSSTEISKKMGIPEPTVRDRLKDNQKEKADILQTTADMIRAEVDKKGAIDVGAGVANHLGISETRLKTAVAILEAEGYNKINIQVDQLGTASGNLTTVRTIARPDLQYRDLKMNPDLVQNLDKVTDNQGRGYADVFKPPLNIDSSRIAVRYAEEGGRDADGVMYVRPGVKDVDIGGSRYAQVRVAVDGTHYLKGMAMYKDDLPAGVDIMFNTNKSNTGNKLDAMKPQTNDPDMPFGSAIRRQIKDADDNVTSGMNIVNEAGQWDSWSRKLSSQVLSKQSPNLAKQQLAMTYERKRLQLDEIMRLTNPEVKKQQLMAFADAADSSAVHLNAAGLPRSSWHVILPFNSLKNNEIYAPNFKDGETVALIRYPHGGTFEIPELTVNNRARAPMKAIGRAPDAVGINSKVAERLSGADFDGDTVIVIPNSRGSIKTSAPLAGLKGFDPQSAYPPYDGMKTMAGGTWNAATKKEVFAEGQRPSGKTKATEMGKVSNLITDMTIAKANSNELARAVRHSMVVIDAEKHKLNWRESYESNNIRELEVKYQPRDDGRVGGSATLISRATGPTRVTSRKLANAGQGGAIDPVTGRPRYVQNKPDYVDKNGKTVTPTQESYKLAETTNAHTLVSKNRTPIELVYADHSNRLKAMANEARKEFVTVPPIAYSPSARKEYKTQVDELSSALNIAFRNRPLERKAQLLANSQVRMKREASPDMDYAQLSKLKAQELDRARSITGAKKNQIYITDDQWKAIQAGAISTNRLRDILNNADRDRVTELARPRAPKLMSPSKLARAQSMIAQGYTQGEIADQLGISLTTLKEGLD